MASQSMVFVGLLFISAIFLGVVILAPDLLIPAYIKIIFLLLSMIFDALAFSSKYYSYLIIPLIKQHKRHIVLSKENAYWMSQTEDTILKRVGDNFIATVYISIPVYRSATEMEDEEKLDFAMQISKLVGLSKDPARYTTELYVMNKDDYIQKLRETISMTENEEAELQDKNAPKKDLERVRGKLAMWRNMLDSISKSLSFELLSYVTVSATGSKEYEAISIAQQKARELMSGIGSLFGVPPSIITGADLLKFVEPEYLIPFSTVTEQINKNIQEQVI
ncbi:hypothetical protein M1373_01465 [Candidatus Marsarchaeota archaeon]|nr:hypothetical protein [Candidatus Marsarchaeota archaeon]MCL5404966.1 hypothetical protein [Candidatus Marsarchaeota archaeon]